MPCTWAEAAAAGTTATEPLSRKTNRVLPTIRLTRTLLSRATRRTTDRRVSGIPGAVDAARVPSALLRRPKPGRGRPIRVGRCRMTRVSSSNAASRRATAGHRFQDRRHRRERGRLYRIGVGQRLRDLLRDGSKRPLVGAALGLLHGVFAGTRAIDLLPIVHPDSAVELSWLLVLVRASDMSRTARVVLTSGDRRIELPPLRFSRMGDPDTWSSRAPPSLDSITSNCSRRSGELLASGSVSGD
jgi:hypothetical protein